MTQTADLSGELYRLLIEAELLGSCTSVLSWDEQTYMPTGGAEHRANQLGLLAGLTHERRTSPRIGELLMLWNPAASRERLTGIWRRMSARPAGTGIEPRSCRGGSSKN